MFRGLHSYNEVLDALEKSFPSSPVGVETVELNESYGRIVAEDVKSTLDVPPFDRSTVDGYAVRSEDVIGAEEDNPIELSIVGSVKIGVIPELSVGKGEAAEIVTGAPLPKGSDSVVMVENADRKDGKVLIYRSTTIGENVMARGSDIKAGETVLQKGAALTPFEIGMLSGIGKNQVKVYMKPKVAVISTGPELIHPGERLTPGKIYDINSYTLGSAIKSLGGEPISFGVIPDDLKIIEEVLDRALRVADIVVTSGGASVGPHDLIPKIIWEWGKPSLYISGVAIKPGKPITLAIVKDKPVFSLPGNPASALLTFYLFVRPVLLKMAGRKVTPLESVKAKAGMKIFPAKGRRTFVTVTLRLEDEGLKAYPVPTGLSGAITTLSRADGFIEVAENQQFISEGEEVTVQLFTKLRKLEG